MRKLRNVLLVSIMATTFGSCSFFQNIFGGGGNKNGCPTSVNNVGAEKMMDGYKPKNKEEAKAIKKAKKSEIKKTKKNPYML
jgi:hypothetical protein